MVVMSPIVERRKRNSVGRRRVNGLHRLPFTDSGDLWLAELSSDRSVGFPVSYLLKGDRGRNALPPVSTGA